MTTLSPLCSIPKADEIALARESGRALSAYLQTRAEAQQIEIFDLKQGLTQTVGLLKKWKLVI